MTTRADIDDFLALRRFAMVGVSRSPKDFSRGLFRDLCARGYDVVPVNLFAEEIDDHEAFQCLQVIRPAVEGALLMTSPNTTEQVVRDCADAGIHHGWMYRAGGQGALAKRRFSSAGTVVFAWWKDTVRICSCPGQRFRIECTVS